MKSFDVLETLADLFLIRGTNGAEFTANLIRKWLVSLGIGTLFIAPGNPRENGYIECCGQKKTFDLPKLHRTLKITFPKHKERTKRNEC
jgi:transposase InsO family protein